LLFVKLLTLRNRKSVRKSDIFRLDLLGTDAVPNSFFLVGYAYRFWIGVCSQSISLSCSYSRGNNAGGVLPIVRICVGHLFLPIMVSFCLRSLTILSLKCIVWRHSMHAVILFVVTSFCVAIDRCHSGYVKDLTTR
jgi:hypothetical protein